MKIFSYLVEETKDLSTSLLSTGLVVIHDTESGSEHNVTETTGRQNIDDPLLDVCVTQIETGRDHSTLVDATDQLNHDLTVAVIVEDLELTNISC